MLLLASLHPALIPSVIRVDGLVIRCLIIAVLMVSRITLLMIFRGVRNAEVPPPVILVIVTEELVLDRGLLLLMGEVVRRRGSQNRLILAINLLPVMPSPSSFATA